jgi:hypothetical protein
MSFKASESSHPEPLAVAEQLLAAGRSFVPIKADGSKRPDWEVLPRVPQGPDGELKPSWTPFQHQLPTQDETHHWFADGTRGIAAIGGAVDGAEGFLEVIDFDHLAVYGPWKAVVQEEMPGLVDRLTHHRTPRPGMHVIYRCSAIDGNTALARVPEVDPKTGKVRPKAIIETRGRGGYFLIPGCPPGCHESGLLYEHISGPPITRTPIINPEERACLWRAARSFNEIADPETIRDEPAKTTVNGALRPGDDYNQRGPDWAAILEPHGWVQVSAGRWRRPGKTKGWSATTGYCRSKAGHELVAVFSSNADPFEGPSGKGPCTCYTKFAAYTLLHHAGDFAAAAKDLAGQGYGEPKRSRGDAAVGNSSSTLFFANYRMQTLARDDETTTIKIGLPVTTLGQTLVERTGGWPKRVDSLLFVPTADHKPLWLSGADEVFAWIGQQLGGRDENAVCWAKGTDKVGRGEFVAYLEQTVETYRAVESFPHEPPLPGVYYLHEQPQGGDGTALRELRNRFKPLTLVDRDLVEAYFLSLFWGGSAGQRPAWLVTTEDDNDPRKGSGSGKTALARMGAHLAGGLIQASPREEMSRLITRLLTPAARNCRVVLLDNIKSLKFSWAELEALITSDVISGHQMYVGEGQRPNSLTWCLTINGASLSRDMAQRTVVIKIERPEYSATWEEETRSLIDGKRWQIIGDCLAILRNPKAPLRRYSRWAAWEAGVLSHVADPSECQKVISERQEAVDEDAGESAVVRAAFVAELESCGYVPDKAAVWISAEQAAGIVNKATGEKYPTNRAGVYLRTLSISELRKSDVHGVRGWAWRGKLTDRDDSVTPM